MFGSSNDFIILIILFLSSFKISKVNPFPGLTVFFQLIFFSNLLIACEDKFLTNLGKLSLAKRIATFVSAFLPKLAIQEPKDQLNLIILDIWTSLRFTSVDILLTKAFLILVVHLVVTNNSCENSSSWKFLLFVLNIAKVLFCVADIILFTCVFVSLTLYSW